jgi:hypothetical protein
MRAKTISLGILLLLLSYPLKADHRHYRGCGHEGYRSANFVSFSVATRHGGGVFVGDFGPRVHYVQPHYYDQPVVVVPRKKHKFNRKYYRRGFAPVHHHYRGHHCPYH